MILKNLVRQKLALEKFDCSIRAGDSWDRVTLFCKSLEDCDRLVEYPLLGDMLKGAHELGLEAIDINFSRELIYTFHVEILLAYDKTTSLFDYLFFKMVGSVKEPQKITIEVKESSVIVRLLPDEAEVADRIWRDYYGALWLAGYHLEAWEGDRQYASSRCCFKSRRTQPAEEA
ncbi:hypothetical protein NDA01_23930 [Trichocoleus desertorum AS-A10]|uniref:hypothetical protein n=1 Tax=Trichocoleus desertorum TaxID=1481672 RepID=UPI0032976AF4